MTKVIIQECKDYSLEAVVAKINNGIEKIGGWDKYVKDGSTVLLKVNLIGPKSSDSAAVTHSEFVRALTRILKAKNCTVWIGDSSGGAIAGIAPTTQSLKVAGYEKVALEEEAVIKNFDKEGIFEVEPHPSSKNKEKMYLAKPLLDADVVINVPKLKTHSANIYTGAVKNVFGCIPGLRKAMYHKLAPEKEGFGEVLADIHQAAKFDLHIMDGITSMQGEGPTAGTVYNSNKILISTDPLALDAVAIHMLGMNIDNIPVMDAARRRNIGKYKLDEIEIDGDYSVIPKLKDFKLAKIYKSTKQKNNKAVIKVIDFFATRPIINDKKCKNCNMCVESCPMGAIDKATKKIDYDRCIECMCCHELCMHKAVELKKNNVFADIIARLSVR